MRLVRYKQNEQIAVGVKVEDQVFPTGYVDMIPFIQDGEVAIQKAQYSVKNEQAVPNFRLLAPIQSPNKVLCSGINYRSHKDENPNAQFPKTPSFFSKLPSSIIGPDEDIIIPAPDMQVDYEVELAFVVGKTAKKVAREQALQYVFGYTILNDISERALQFQLQHETIGKGIDTFCPLGPEIVLCDEIADPSQLHVASFVNGEQRQSSPTSEMLFDIPTLIEKITAYITLYPGDVVATGTPAGVGVFRNPPSFLQPGDVVEVVVNQIGTLRNRMIAGW